MYYFTVVEVHDNTFMFQILKTGPIIGPLIYPALLDLCFLPDSANILMVGPQEDNSTISDTAVHVAELHRRAIGLECNIARVLGRDRSGAGWFISALDPPPQNALISQCGLQVIYFFS